MAKLFRGVFLALFATALLWAVVIWHWQRTQRAIEVQDIVLYLLVLPLLVVGGVLALRWAWRRAALAQASKAAANTSAAPVAAVPAPAERQLVMRVLAQGIAAPGADGAAALLERLADTVPVQIDPSLQDLEGQVVFTRRCGRLEAEDAMDRAIALAERSVEPVLQALQARAVEAEGDATPEELPAHPTLKTPRKPAREKQGLRVLWGLAEHAEEAERTLLQTRAQQAAQRWARQVPAFDWRFEPLPVRSGEALLLQAERRLLMAHREGRDELLLLVAAESWIDAALVEKLDAQGQLFSAARRTGVMPGEAAAALLLAPPVNLGGAAADGVSLHRLSAQRRDKSADAAGRITAATLSETLRQLLDATALPAEQLTLALTDTDLRASRTGELFEALQHATPHLATLELTRCAGMACGAIGLAAAPLVLALAAQRTQQQREATLVIAHADPFDRLAAVLSPPAA